MSDETWEKVLDRLREEGTLREGVDTDQLRACAERLIKAIVDAFYQIVEFIIQVIPQIVETRETVLPDIKNILAKIEEYLESHVKPHPRLQRVPQRIDAPKARRIFDRRPQFHHARSTVGSYDRSISR